MPLLTPSGGLVYHLRALRYRQGLWASFRSGVAEWLAPLLPGGDELILVGPSAGHCLPLEQLRRYRRLLVLEPDPLARRLLLFRLGHPRVEVETRDLLVEPLLSGRSGLDAVLERRPGAALLLCNVLGQLHFGLNDSEQARFGEQFAQRVVPLLSERAWASFHDRFSLDRDAAEPRPGPLWFPELPSDEALAAACFPGSKAALTLLDHGTSGLFPVASPRRYLAWQLTPSALHWVEALPAPSER